MESIVQVSILQTQDSTWRHLDEFWINFKYIENNINRTVFLLDSQIWKWCFLLVKVSSKSWKIFFILYVWTQIRFLQVKKLVLDLAFSQVVILISKPQQLVPSQPLFHNPIKLSNPNPKYMCHLNNVSSSMYISKTYLCWLV